MSDDILFGTNQDPILIRIAETRARLAMLNFDAERSNDRSALVLLALLQLKPDASWATAANPTLRTVEIMSWIRENYGRDYKPNTRETIRRQTLHQFVDATLVEQNPDNAKRPINSPKWCYRIHPQALELLRAPDWSLIEGEIRAYLEEIPGLRELYAKARQMNRIPVTLPSGEALMLSPGGQNVLIKEMIEEFCALFTPGGHILYVGDADAKWSVFEEEGLARLGVQVRQHGKMPDLVVHLPERNWLILLEATSSHGPVDAHRHRELSQLFDGSTAGLVFVSCFPTREAMRPYLTQIAWETDAWCADNPTHLIHFNGERFLGPYGDPAGPKFPL